ncbi:MAG: hypothetical protein JNN07_12835 [Verrucomicrobiales bacterium]|nr:hypothetical protein [Verrucomicrobiales bacterium]
MIRFFEPKRKWAACRQTPGTTFFRACAFVLVWVGCVSLPQVLRAGTTVTIPGEIQVTIQPPEAVAEGARWSVDGGAFQLSGASVANVAAGGHAIQFSDLAAWVEPATTELLVVGGKSQEVTVTYRRLPSFYFRAVPAQQVREGTTLEFLVGTDDPGDPQNPGPGASLQFSAAPQPSGLLTFDQATGRFSYAPKASDRLPFTVKFSTQQGLEGTVEITPLNSRALEDEVIELDPPAPLDPLVPDDETRNYIQITETRNAPEFFNGLTNETVNVSISGKTLIFEAGHPAHLYDEYNTNRLNLREMRLYADKVIIRSPLIWRQTQVRIQARELRFEGEGRIETTPMPPQFHPAGASFFEDDLKVGRDGIPGHDAGNVEVLVERFFSDATTATRFVLLGGEGGPAGQGRNGQAEADLEFNSANWKKLMSRAGNRICSTDGPTAILFLQRIRIDEDGDDTVTSTCGARVSARGENAVRSGFPGAGGRGGTLRSTVNLEGFAKLTGGIAGPRGSDYVGGLLSSRQFMHRVVTSMFLDGKNRTSTVNTPAQKVPGANAAAPAGTNGLSGSFLIETNSGSWVSSFAVRHVVQFAKDLYLGGRAAEARRLLGDYQAFLRAHDQAIPVPEELGDTEFAEKASRDQLQAEADVVAHRLDSNLDYFGNPAGWVPMLSFEANLIAFQNEIRHSIPILYLSYWLQNTATNLEGRLVAATNSLAALASENARLIGDFNTAQLAIPGLRNEAEVITVRIGGLRQRLALKLTELERRARENVEDRHKLPFWKKALGVLSVVADLVPVGQPTVGRIGSGLSLLAQVDGDKPLESAIDLAPNAFGVMTNKNISVCFGTNAPSNTSTNSGSSTNDVKKAKKKLLNFSNECNKFLGDELKELAGVFKDAQVDDKELAAELEKLKASDPVFQELVADIEALNTQKAEFVQRLTAALQIIGTVDSALAANLISANDLETQLAAGFAALDHGALLHIKEMERRAKDRLLQYQYFLAKSFHYRELRPYRGTLQLNRLFDRFKQLVETGNNHLLNAEQFREMEALFTAELREIVLEMLDNINAPDVVQTQPFRLTAAELQELNEQGRVVVNLSRLGLLTLTKENIRIADWQTKSMSVQPVGGELGRSAVVGINYEHSGVSRLTSAGRKFLFRHYTAQTENPIVWHTIFNARDGNLSNSELSPAETSLLSVLLEGQSNVIDKLMFFSEPAAMADVLITKEVATENGVDLAITDLEFEVKLNFDNSSSVRRQLDVVVPQELTPVITVSRVDLNGRQDGQGSFSRIFSPFAQVSLQAPARFGEFVFDRWMIDGRAVSTPGNVVTLTMASDTLAQPLFRRSPESFALTPIPGTGAEIGFTFPTQPGTRYLIEQAFQMANPVWATIETRTGDGSPQQFTRAISANATVFFRVRTEQP